MVWIHTKTQVNEQGEVEYLVTPDSLARIEAEERKAAPLLARLEAKMGRKMGARDGER